MANIEQPDVQLPLEVVDTLRNIIISEVSTLTGSGVPINTPLLCFPRDTGIIEVTTGLAYPAKANRARKNPKVGMLFESVDAQSRPTGKSTVLIAALASVRDANLADNSARYAREPVARMITGAQDWEAGRDAIWYFTRIWIQCTPIRAWWWSKGDEPVNQWSAPTGTVAPPSDPAPESVRALKSSWSTGDISSRVAQVLELSELPHLTLVDPEGWPMPIRTRAVTKTADGFVLKLPRWLPWRVDGPACLSFAPTATFIGEVHDRGSDVLFVIDHILPDLPIAQDGDQILHPKQETREGLLDRLNEELALRGQSMPVLPDEL
jgi:hypothetical protein